MATATDSHHFRELAHRSHQARRVNALERRIREVVEAAPPLTEAQRDRLALALRPTPTPLTGEAKRASRQESGRFSVGVGAPSPLTSEIT